MEDAAGFFLLFPPNPLSAADILPEFCLKFDLGSG